MTFCTLAVVLLWISLNVVRQFALNGETNIRYVIAERTRSLRASAEYSAPLNLIDLDFLPLLSRQSIHIPLGLREMLLIGVTLLIVFLNRTLAIILPPANPAINLAVGSSAPSLNALNATSGPTCDSNSYGFNLNRRSCVEAVERLIPSSSWIDQSVVYVNRDKDISGVRIVLPWRELSCTSH